YARRITPCFDEPRWKPAWRVTAIVPPGLVALGNGPIAEVLGLHDGRHEVHFAEVGAMPSYLLAIAVGPFDILEVRKLGRRGVLVRIAALKGDARRVDAATRILPRLIDVLESYLDRPLPSAKLDLVVVPSFFGAMENLGLITVSYNVLVGRNQLDSVVT